MGNFLLWKFDGNYPRKRNFPALETGYFRHWKLDISYPGNGIFVPHCQTLCTTQNSLYRWQTLSISKSICLSFSSNGILSTKPSLLLNSGFDLPFLTGFNSLCSPVSNEERSLNLQKIKTCLSHRPRQSNKTSCGFHF